MTDPTPPTPPFSFFSFSLLVGQGERVSQHSTKAMNNLTSKQKKQLIPQDSRNLSDSCYQFSLLKLRYAS